MIEKEVEQLTQALITKAKEMHCGGGLHSSFYIPVEEIQPIIEAELPGLIKTAEDRGFHAGFKRGTQEGMEGSDST